MKIKLFISSNMYCIPSWLSENWRLTAPYFYSEKRIDARRMLVILILMELISIGMSVLFSYWHNAFFNALQQMDQTNFVRLLLYFPFLVLTTVIVTVGKEYMSQLFELHWRDWLTKYFLNNYLSENVYYKLLSTTNRDDHIDQKIFVDIGSYISHTCHLTVGGLQAIGSFISHLFILWSLSDVIELRLTQYFSCDIPGDLLWTSIICAGIGILLTDRIGHNLVHLNCEQARHEANFRYGLARLRDHVESIAMYRGESHEKSSLTNLLSALMSNFREIMRSSFRLNCFSYSFTQISDISPYLVASPRYFSKKITLGDLTQIRSSFGQVQMSLIFIITSYTRIAEWRAATKRLIDLVNTIKNLRTIKQNSKIKLIRSSKKRNIRIKRLTAQLPTKNTVYCSEILFENFNWIFKPHQSVLITGKSGCGKSTLLRILAGIWHYGHGSITLPSKNTIEFVPQNSYCPLGSLRHCLTYPSKIRESLEDDANIKSLLRLCQLESLTNRLDDVGDWSLILSSGEQQKMAFVRVLFHRPNWIFLDEATSSLDELSEIHLYSTLLGKLKLSTIISIGHRKSLRQFHDVLLHCVDRQITRINEIS